MSEGSRVADKQKPSRDARGERAGRVTSAQQSAHRDLAFSLSVSAHFDKLVVTLSGAGLSDVSLEEAAARLDALERAVEELEAENRSLQERVEGLALRGEGRDVLEPREDVQVEGRVGLEDGNSSTNAHAKFCQGPVGEEI